MAAEAHGAVAYFDSAEAILDAAKAAKSKGLQDYESFTPFPVHGMEEALGLKHSIVPWATFVCGLTGFLVANGLQIWTSAIDWPINVGGKPFVSLPAFIPIMFELTVLFGGLGTFFFMLVLNGLPSGKRPLDPRLTDDRFALYVPFSEKNGKESDVQSFLKGLNPERVSLVTEPV